MKKKNIKKSECVNISTIYSLLVCKCPLIKRTKMVSLKKIIHVVNIVFRG